MRRALLLVTAAVMLSGAALAGCTPSPTRAAHESDDALAGLRTQAALAPCPVPPPTPTATASASASASAGATGTGTGTGTTGAGSPTAGGSGSPPGSSPSGSGSASVSATLSATADTAPMLPDVTLPCLAGGPDVPVRGLAGTPMVLNLWATWCAPCRKELPAFQQAFAHADPRTLRVLGIVTEDPGMSRPLSFAADTKVHIPDIVDDHGVIARELGARGLPATVFLDATGTVTHLYNGPPLDYRNLKALVARYLDVDIHG